jgi:metallo-beta-lactamase family protein
VTDLLSFFGAADTVTGSRYLLETGGRRVLVDCGLFQGYKKLRQRNWSPFPVAPSSINAVLLTHAHLDHSGYLPRLARMGFSGPVYCTAATRDLCHILLLDSAYLNEKDADRSTRLGYTSHHPARPLYDRDDAKAALKLLRPVEFETPLQLDGLRARFRRAGHILGAASISVETPDRTIVFSGDIGRHNDLTMPDPEPFEHADVLLIESTYGDRLHDHSDAEAQLANIISGTTARGGTVLIPAFAVGRAQTLLFMIQRLKAGGRIGNIPVFLDSPMAIDASEIYKSHPRDHKMDVGGFKETFAGATYVTSVEASKALTMNRYPKVIVSASGMATGGRILHHLSAYLRDYDNTILLPGFQAGGTRGAQLAAGAQQIKIHGQYVPVHAEVVQMHQLSAHADRDGLLQWLGGFREPPRTIFVTHGEDASSDALRLAIKERAGTNVVVPEHLQCVDLDRI